jgi:NADH-quinone oxidoreductase subunit E
MATQEVQAVDRILDTYAGEEGVLIQVLLDVQREYNWLPEEVLRRISERMELPLKRVYQVASFYRAFSLTPRGRHVASVCMGTACHVRGALRISERAETVLGIKVGETTADKDFTLTTVNCLGCCALGPVMVIDEEAHGKLVVGQVQGILETYS